MFATGKEASDFWLPKEVGLKILEVKTSLDFDLGQFVTIPGGINDIGSPTTEPDRRADEKLHKVELSPYSIMDAAVTQESYAKIMGDNPSQFKDPKYCPLSFKEVEVNGNNIGFCADHPVEYVSWNDANKFAERLSKLGLKI